MRPRTAPRPRAIDTPVALSAEEVAFVRSMVIYEDADVLALNKPPGLSSQGGRAQVHTLDELLWAFVKPNGVRPRLVHRLDRDTSGVVLTARTKAAAASLGKAMMARRGFRKTYLALVGPGAPDPAQGRIEAPLRREEIGREAYVRVCEPDAEGAQAALTRYRTLSATSQTALVELRPETGRMHQLRVHLAHLGRPILGDARYGGALALGGGSVPRLMLHAASLGFPHPAGDSRVVEAPLPPDFMNLAGLAGLTPPR